MKDVEPLTAENKFTRLNRNILNELIGQGYKYAAIIDFTQRFGKTTLVIKPMRTAMEEGRKSVTALTDAMITAPLDGDTDTIQVLYIL